MLKIIWAVHVRNKIFFSGRPPVDIALDCIDLPIVSNASERLYDVKVAVYESKASLDDIFKDKDPVVTMTGSMGY